ncbi:SDR family oxidoreductase [Amycolatopsis sp. NPDC059657]|uniref:SDR family oxidoreductase n=1 Tax=Amycolatopsis sp. NPDC059657 TaxID=3346899 RepID=UPI00366B7E56
METANIDLGGEVAVVTGVLGKLGSVWASALAGAGATVVGLDLADTVTPALAEVRRNHGEDKLVLLKADVTDRAGLRTALEACLAGPGAPTVLVNNAGIDQPPSAAGERSWLFEDLPDERSAGVLDVNAHGTLRMCQVFGSEMARRGKGSVINIGSLYGGVAPDPRMYDHLPLDPPFLKPPAYGMSKAGVAALSRYLAAAWGPAGVRVNTLSPGGVLGGQDPEFLTKFSARVPMRRLAVAPDLAGPLLFLASGLSSYVTGTELVVDGGFTAW